MGRPYTGKVTESLVRERQANGDTYVYLRRTQYNRDSKRTVSLGKTLLGKIPCGEVDMVPTRPKKKPHTSDAAGGGTLVCSTCACPRVPA